MGGSVDWGEFVVVGSAEDGLGAGGSVEDGSGSGSVVEVSCGGSSVEDASFEVSLGGEVSGAAVLAAFLFVSEAVAKKADFNRNASSSETSL